MWLYTDVYHSLVNYVSQDLRDGAFKLNWGIVAIAELMPRVIIHFTLQNVNTNHGKTWANVLVRETMAQLTLSTRNKVNRYKDELV